MSFPWCGLYAGYRSTPSELSYAKIAAWLEYQAKKLLTNTCPLSIIRTLVVLLKMFKRRKQALIRTKQMMLAKEAVDTSLTQHNEMNCYSENWRFG
jgi:hypothetical protein